MRKIFSNIVLFIGKMLLNLSMPFLKITFVYILPSLYIKLTSKPTYENQILKPFNEL